MQMQPTLNNENVQKGLRVRLGIYITLAILLCAVLFYRILVSHLNLFFPIAGLVIGGIWGFYISRIYKIYWDEKAEKVIFRLDVYSIILLIVYIFFEIYREKIVDYFISGPAIALTSFTLLTGAIIGRVVGIRRKIKVTLKENL
jgi:predicted Na+-dependent transporter